MPKQVMKTDLQHMQITDDIDILLTLRTHVDDGTSWSEELEEASTKAHDGIGKFLADCVKHKKEVYACIKSVKAANAAGAKE